MGYPGISVLFMFLGSNSVGSGSEKGSHMVRFFSSKGIESCRTVWYDPYGFGVFSFLLCPLDGPLGQCRVPVVVSCGV